MVEIVKIVVTIGIIISIAITIIAKPVNSDRIRVLKMSIQVATLAMTINRSASKTNSPLVIAVKLIVVTISITLVKY